MRTTESRLRRVIRQVIRENSMLHEPLDEEVVDDIVDKALNNEPPGLDDYLGLPLSDNPSSPMIQAFVAVYCIKRDIDISGEKLELACKQVEKNMYDRVVHMGDNIANKLMQN